MQLTAEIASLKEQLTESLSKHETLKGAHKALNEQVGTLTTEKTALTETIAAHEKTIGEHASKITDLEGKLAEAEKKAGLTQTQISSEVVKTLASTGVPPIKRDANAAVTDVTPDAGGDKAGRRQRVADALSEKFDAK